MQRRESKKTGKVVAHVIPASVNPLEQVFDDVAEEVPNLRCDNDTFTCEAGPRGLADVEIIARKESKELLKRRKFRSKVTFQLQHYDLFMMIIRYIINRY